MASDYRFTGNGTTVYLVNSSGSPTAGGAATAAATTPWQIATQYTPQAAPPRSVWSGGPPFRHGQNLAYLGYDNVTETIPIFLKGSNQDTVAARVQQLRQTLMTTLFTSPCVFYAQPSGASSAMYADIYAAHVQERGGGGGIESPGEGSGDVIVDVTITRSPFFGVVSTGETVLSSASFGNTGTGSPNNIVAYSTGSGDLIYEGQPLNLDIVPSASSWKLMLSSIYDRLYDTGGAGTLTTSSTTFVTNPISGSGLNIDPVMTRKGLKGRLLVHFTSPSTNIEVYGRVLMTGSGGTTELYASPPITPDNVTPQMLDFGGFSFDAFRNTNTASGRLQMGFGYRSTNGSSASITITFVEVLFYYDFCTINGNGNGFARARLAAFAERSGLPCLPLPSSAVFEWDNTNSRPTSMLTLRGTPPRYYSGAQLYYAAFVPNSFATVHKRVTTDTATITATHAPLWRTFRGAD